MVVWSDSVDVLYWIRSCSRKFKPFVANRVGEVQSLTDPEQWRHEPTKQNPAYLLTRGLSVPTLMDEESWWKGSEFLMQEEKRMARKEDWNQKGSRHRSPQALPRIFTGTLISFHNDRIPLGSDQEVQLD